MTPNNTIEGVHLFPVNGELLYKPKAKKYYWHIPRALQDKDIQVNSVVRVNKKQIVLVTKVFHENFRETGKKYASISKIQEFQEQQPAIREATTEELKKLNNTREKA
ncbi:hypothetical protein AUF15_03545 [Enterococcus avium]|uniref:DUF5839 family protein n=1 Tax=Enterococcus avium TaxID=33945 RepID=UPI001184741F|nr:DUF5839 family protein [Enterococcus avium]TRZ30078.1 hypothetical protein AUF15_03545 [Enterococcus avium]